MPTSKNPLGRVGPGLWRGLCSAAGAALLAMPPAMSQTVYRVPVPLRDYAASEAARICGTGGAGPFSPQGCTVPRTNRSAPFTLKIDPLTGVVTTRPLEPGHILLNLEQWEKFRRSNPAGN